MPVGSFVQRSSMRIRGLISGSVGVVDGEVCLSTKFTESGAAGGERIDSLRRRSAGRYRRSAALHLGRHRDISCT